MVLTQVNTWCCRSSRFLKWCGSDIPEHQKQTLPQMSVAWSHSVKLLSACILTQKTLGRAEGRGMKAGRGWSLFKLAWLLKTTLCNSILISMQLHRYSHTLPVWWALPLDVHEHSPAPKTWVLGLPVQRINWHSCTCSCYLRPCLYSWLLWPGTFSAVCHLGAPCFGNHSSIQELVDEIVRLIDKKSS